MSKSVLANKIGYSLFEVAKENNTLEEVSYELKEVAKVVNGNSDFVTLMNNPNLEKIKKFDYYKDIKVKSAENENILEILNKVYDLTIQAFKNNFLYSELEREIFIKMYMRYEDKIVKKFFKTLYLKDELIGYVFGIPDYAELEYKGKIETMILKTIAVSPKYNGKGMGYILIDELVKETEKSGYKNVIYALMYEKNISKNIGLLLGDELRRYTLFIKEL